MPNTCKEATLRFVYHLATFGIFSNRAQDYQFDYSDGENGDDSGTVDVENMYYTAKCSFSTPFHSCGSGL